MDKILRYLLASIIVALIVRLGVDLFIFNSTLSSQDLLETAVFAVIFGAIFMLFGRIFKL